MRETAHDRLAEGLLLRRYLRGAWGLIDRFAFDALRACRTTQHENRSPDRRFYWPLSCWVYITTNTLTRTTRTLAAMVSVLCLAGVAACDQLATVVGEGVSSSQSETAVSFRATVVGVSDGDTITVRDETNQQHKIRLAEIDAPERGQPWADRSRQALSVLVFGKMVSVQQTDTDRYGRVVARVFGDSEDVNRAMVQDGHAWAYRQYLTDDTLLATEARARAERSGLWSMSDAQTVPPWEWRQGVRVGQAQYDRRANPRQQRERSSGQPVQSLLSATEESADALSLSSGSFTCSGKRYCRQMNSCEEAHYYLQVCGVSSLDGNSDGEPCEMLCGTAG